jgi:uncharacterized membrane protein
MTWEQRHRMRRTARTSLVLWAGLSLAAALVAAPAVRWLDHETNWKMFAFSPDGARAILGALVSSMLTFIVFVLSAALIVVQLASGQSSPRVIALVLAMPWVRVALGILTFTFTFTLAALGRIEDRVPDLEVSIAVVLNLLSLIVFFGFVHRLAGGLRPAALIQLVADRAEHVFDEVYPLPFDPNRPECAGRPTIENPDRVIEYRGQSGAVLAFSAKDLARYARLSDFVVQLVPQVGDFIATGDPLFRLSIKNPILDPILPEDDLRGCVAVGLERTIEQDPRFVFRILVDIASKALSPAINDPTTAVQAIDQIQRLLLNLGWRYLDEGRLRDAEGTIRLVFGTPDWPDFVVLAVSEVRQFGAASIQVNRRLRAMLEHLIEVLPAERRLPLEQELALLTLAVKQQFDSEVDRKRASEADNQGVGGSE